ncbi:hypothetical protein D4764_12G0010950 [Takifugu flavidus]|uniref:Retrovirus-related Pol polyprotein from type-1 retrotransposable element n=1 Tax=Takifugu flavidus TaxID=433684 RepID=A0A5C6PE88_9TELE|nr:hypothetical protein D4764_12G0010950 [Takifugu flavidus]
MISRRGKVIATNGVELPEGNITGVQDSYKYLGIPQANGNHEEAARRSATAKYLQRLRQVLKSQLNGKHKIQAINTYALPVIRYPAGIIPWPLEEIQATDIKTRKLLTMHGGFHPKSSVLRLYTKRKEGGRGLVSVRTTVQEETTSLQEYIKKMAPTDPLLSECLRQQKPTKEEEPEGLSWKDKPLHGMYHQQIEEVADIEKTYQWLTKAGLKDSTEALIMAAQEQALSTRAIEARVYHTRQDPRNICTEYGLEVPGARWETPPKGVENEQAKILWDFQTQTDKMVVANQPDIVVVDKHRKTVVVIDVAIPSDSNIRKKEHEKLEKYQGLKEEMERMWGMKATVVPVVIWTLWAVTPNLSRWLQQIPGTTPEISVQKSAVLGTAKILRRTLRLPGLW